MKNSLLKSMPRLLLFFLVILPLGAFAADASTTTSSMNIFQPNPGDLSVYFLGQVFGTVGGVLHGTGGQLLGQILGVLNTGIVLVMGAYLSYSVFLFVVYTSQDGEMMANKGKSTIFMAFRTAAGFALAIPSKATGYCLAQTIVMWMVVQGVGLADHAWTRVVDYLTKEGGTVYAYQDQTVTSKDVEKVIPIATQILQSEVCLYKVKNMQNKQQQQNSASSSSNVVDESDLPPTNISSTTDALGFSFNDTNMVTFGSKNSKWDPTDKSSVYIQNEYNYECGSISYAEMGDREMSGSDLTYQQAAITQVILDLQPLAKKIAELPNDQVSTLSEKEFQTEASYAIMSASIDYTNLITPLRRQTLETSNKEAAQQLEDAKNAGWILAGGYYRNLTTINNKATGDLSLLNPTVDPASALLRPSDYNGIDNIFDNFNKNSDDMNALTQMVNITGTYSMSATALSNQIMGKMADVSFSEPIEKIVEKAKSAVSTKNMMLSVFVMPSAVSNAPTISKPILIGIMVSLNNFFDYWGDHLSTSGDPMTNLQKIGGKMMEIAGWLWLAVAGYISGVAAVKGLLASVNSGFSQVDSGLRWIMPIATAYMIAFFAGGIMLGVYVPMIPVLVFAFAAIGWIVAVLEAMVAAPLVALGLTHPEGHDFLGKTEQGIMLVFGVFLRPILLIIGLVAAMLLAQVGIKVFNIVFAVGLEKLIDMRFDGTFPKLFTFFGSIVIYVLAMVFIVNSAYNLMPLIVDNVLKWLGLGQQPTGFEQGLENIKGGLQSASQTASKAFNDSLSAKADSLGQQGKEKGFSAKGKKGG